MVGGSIFRPESMITRQYRQSWLKRLILPALTLAVLGYFGCHAFHGYYGIWSMDRLEAEAVRLAVQADNLEKERATLEQRVNLLRADKLDADLVDLEARAALNRIRPDELVIRTGH